MASKVRVYDKKREKEIKGKKNPLLYRESKTPSRFIYQMSSTFFAMFREKNSQARPTKSQTPIRRIGCHNRNKNRGIK